MSGRLSVKVKGSLYEPAWLSYSTVNTYRMCGRKFLFSKVMRLEGVPGLAAIGGNAVHAATERLDRERYTVDSDCGGDQ